MSEEVFGYMKMNILSPYICHGPEKLSIEQRLKQLQLFNQHLTDLYTKG